MTDPKGVRTAWFAYLGCWLLVAGIIMAGNVRTTTPVYREAALNWWVGAPIYNEIGHGFLYLPSAALLYLPIALLPEIPSDLIWRVVTLGLFAFGVRRLAKVAGQERGQELFPWMTVVCLPMAWTCVRNGQMTLVMAATMMLGTADLADRRWWRATLWLSLGLAAKPLILVLILLVAALYPTMTWRLVLGCLLVVLAPFCMQRPAYVLEQYHQVFVMLGAANRIGLEYYYAQLFGMLRVIGVEIPDRGQWLLRCVAGIATLGMGWQALRTFSAQRAAIFLYALSVAYLMLFNPRTENGTYAALAPPIAVFLALALAAPRTRPTGTARFTVDSARSDRWLAGNRRHATIACLAIIAVGAGGSFEISKLVATAEHAMWAGPLMTCGFVGFLSLQLATGAANWSRLSRPAQLRASQGLLTVSRPAEAATSAR